MTESEESRALLKKRAGLMAAPPEAAAEAGARAEFLEFGLGGERYAVELGLVREVCSGRRITRIPGAPPFMAGAANIRGRILPVADLALFFGLRAEAPDRRKLVILRGKNAAAPETGGEPLELGILADAVAGVRALSPAEIQPPPTGFSGSYGQYLGGVTPEGLVIFLADKFLAACAEAAPPAAEERKNTGGEQ